MISEKARGILSQPMGGDPRDELPAISFSDHKGDSCVTRVFRSNYNNDAFDRAREWLDIAITQCRSLANDMRVMVFPFSSAVSGGRRLDNVVAVVSAYDLVEARVDTLGVVNGTSMNTTKSYDLKVIRAKHPRAYDRWTAEEEEVLAQLYHAGVPIGEIATRLGRQPGGIGARLTRLGLSLDLPGGTPGAGSG